MENNDSRDAERLHQTQKQEIIDSNMDKRLIQLRELTPRIHSFFLVINNAMIHLTP
jgi:hypothetical protein